MGTPEASTKLDITFIYGRRGLSSSVALVFVLLVGAVTWDSAFLIQVLCVCFSFGFAGTKSMSAKDDAEVESSLLGGVGGGGVYLSDALYSEDSVLSSSCHFTLGDVDPEDSGLALFGDVTDDGKVDYSWDNCLSDLEDVDNLLRWASFPG